MIDDRHSPECRLVPIPERDADPFSVVRGSRGRRWYAAECVDDCPVLDGMRRDPPAGLEYDPDRRCQELFYETDEAAG